MKAVQKRFAWERCWIFALSAVPLAGALLFASCAHRPAFNPKMGVEATEEVSQEVKTMRGKAWISVKSSEGNVAFPATVLIDRTNPAKPQMRLEAADLAGSTHAMMVLDSTGRFLWINFDKHTYWSVSKEWYGFPVRNLPNLLLGLLSMPKDGRVSAAGAASDATSNASMAFRVEPASIHQAPFTVTMDWVDPGPRLRVQSIASDEGYTAEFSHYLDKDDFYLPSTVKLLGRKLQIQLDWRSRQWNTPLESGSDKLFSTKALLKNVLKTFRHVD